MTSEDNHTMIDDLFIWMLTFIQVAAYLCHLQKLNLWNIVDTKMPHPEKAK